MGFNFRELVEANDGGVAARNAAQDIKNAEAKAKKNAPALARSNPGRVPIPTRNPAAPAQAGTPPTPWNSPNDVMASGLRRYQPQFQKMQRPGDPGADWSSRAQMVDPYHERAPDNVGPDGTVQNFDSHGAPTSDINAERDQRLATNPRPRPGGFFDNPNGVGPSYNEQADAAEARIASPQQGPGSLGRPALESRYSSDLVNQGPKPPNGARPPGAPTGAPQSAGPAQGQAFGGGGGQGGNWLSRARASSGMGGGGGRRPSPPAMSGGQSNPMFGGGQPPAPLPGPVPNMHAGANPNFNEAAGSGLGMGAVPPQQVRQQVQSPAALPGMAASASQSPPNPGLAQALRGAPQPRPYQRQQGG